MIMKVILNNYYTLSKPVKASLWFTFCVVIQRGLQFIGMPIYTRIMSTEEYGIYSVFLSWFTLLCVFSSLNIYSSTFNKAMVKFEEQREDYISSVQCLTLFFGIGLSLLILCFNNYVAEKTGFSLKFQLLLCIHLISFPSLQYWTQKQKFIFEYKKVVLVTLLSSSLSLLLGIVFVLLSTNADKAFVLVAVTVGVQALINAIIFFSLSIKGTPFNEDYWKWTIVMAFPLLPHFLSEVLLAHANRLMIKQMCGASQAGIYNVVYQISMVLTILRQGINGSFLPWLYYSLKEEKYNDIRIVTKKITVLMAFLTVVFMLIGPEILKIAAPPSYYVAVSAIPAIMIGCFCMFLYVMFVNIEIYFEQNQYIAFPSIIATIINIALNYICINRFGYLSAAYTTMFSYLLMAIMHYGIMQYIIRKKTCVHEIYDIKFMVLILCLLVLLGIVLLKLYNYLLLRWLLIVVLFLTLLNKRKKINYLLQSLKKRE